jgi:hypothetical protein
MRANSFGPEPQIAILIGPASPAGRSGSSRFPPTRPRCVLSCCSESRPAPPSGPTCPEPPRSWLPALVQSRPAAEQGKPAPTTQKEYCEDERPSSIPPCKESTNFDSHAARIDKPGSSIFESKAVACARTRRIKNEGNPNRSRFGPSVQKDTKRRWHSMRCEPDSTGVFGDCKLG